MTESPTAAAALAPVDAVVFALEVVLDTVQRAYPGTVALLDRLRAGGVPVLLATSAPDAGPLLAAAGLESVFDVVVSGQGRGPGRDDLGAVPPALAAVRRLDIA